MKRSLTYGLSWSFLVVSSIALGLAACAPEERNFGDSSSASSSGTGGDGGSGMACTPDKTEPCYTGPAETLEVGLCIGGMHVCLPSGVGFGECGGEVTPTAENCLTPDDEACNGNDPKECPTLADGWLKTYGTAGSGQYVHAVAVTNTGDIVVVGSFGDMINFGKEPMASTGSSDIFVAKLDPLGDAIWSRRFGDASSQSAFAVGIDSMGGIYVGGAMAGKVDFDGTVLTSAGTEDAFLARFEPDGKLAWAHNWGDTASQTIRHIKVTKTNSIIVAGEFKGTLQFDAGPNKLTSAGGNDIFVARFDTSGFIASSRVFGGTLTETVRGLAVDSVGQIYLTGGFEGMANFDGPMLVSTGARDGYVAKLGTNLNTVNVVPFGNPNGPNSVQEGFDVAVTESDEVFVTGGFAEGLSIFGAFLTNAEPLSRSMFLAHINGQFTDLIATPQQFGGLGGVVGDARLAIDPATKQVVLAGAFTGDVDFGGGLLHAEAAADPYFAKLGFDGTFVAARTLPNEVTPADNTNNINALALLPSGDLIIGGVQRVPLLYGNMVVGEVDIKDGNAMLGRFLH